MVRAPVEMWKWLGKNEFAGTARLEKSMWMMIWNDDDNGEDEEATTKTIEDDDSRRMEDDHKDDKFWISD